MLRRALSAVSVQSDPVVYDVIVVGGGHAGVEAAAAAARCSARTLLLTPRKDTIGEMSCNPSFGGVGKGHLIREIDALDGVCGRICDKSAINYRALNTSQGPAVLGLRAQIDRKLYKKHMQHEILNCTRGLDVLERGVDDLIIENKDGFGQRIAGIVANNQIFQAKAVVVSTGTFLGGKVYRGSKSYAAGRMGENWACTKLSETFKQLGFELGRFRTGTPARLLKKTIDFSKFTLQQPDQNPIPFSFLTENIWLPISEQLPTYLGFTNNRLAEVVLKHVQEGNYIRSEANGPRYCPSLESRIVRFPHLNHRIFLEQEGLDSELIYPQSMSMTFEPEVQLEIYRCVPGLENVEMAEAGYGVEYDYVNPKQLKSTLQTKAVEGIIAGINAAAYCHNKEPLIIDRAEGYIGVLIDDLTSLGTCEPYRMFTSRAEFRLHLRPDNADMRLTRKGHKQGAISEHRYEHFLRTLSAYNETLDLLKSVKYSLNYWQKYIPRLKGNPACKVYSSFDLLSRYAVGFTELRHALPAEFERLLINKDIERRLAIEGLYQFYIDKMLAKMEQIRKECATTIPDHFDYSKMKYMSAECKEKFELWRPQNLAAASRIPGATAEVLMELLTFLRAPNYVASENGS